MSLHKLTGIEIKELEDDLDSYRYGEHGYTPKLRGLRLFDEFAPFFATHPVAADHFMWMRSIYVNRHKQAIINKRVRGEEITTGTGTRLFNRDSRVETFVYELKRIWKPGTGEMGKCLDFLDNICLENYNEGKD